MTIEMKIEIDSLTSLALSAEDKVSFLTEAIEKIYSLRCESVKSDDAEAAARSMYTVISEIRAIAHVALKKVKAES